MFQDINRALSALSSLFKEQDSSRANSGQVGLIGVWKTNLDMILEIILQQSQALIDHIT